MKKNILHYALCIILGTFLMISCQKGNMKIVEKEETQNTIYDESEFVLEVNGVDETFIIVKVEDLGEGTGTMTWTKDKVWILNGFIYVNEGQTLTIESGTIIKGKSGQGESASALIVARGGKIIAEGKKDSPIIFTAESDNIYRNKNVFTDGDNIGAGISGLWGGVIILGRASANLSTGEKQIEGIPTSETRGLYGGTNDKDNSGILKYVSIRHGGTNIGSGNEINGLTLGAVGSGTIVEYVEVFSNVDDGFEWFGGTVNTKYLVSAFCGDDAMDYDEGWRGMNQYWFVFQGNGKGDRGGEHDGGPSDCETCTPYATPIIANATFQGSGKENEKRALTFRDNAGGKYYNSIFMDYGKGVDIELLDSECSYDQLINSNLVFAENILFNISEHIFGVADESSMRDSDVINAELNNYFSANNNALTDPELENWIPVVGGAAASGGFTVPESFFEKTEYKGAFAPDTKSWIEGWTKTSNNL